MFESLRGSAEAILFSQTNAEMRVAVLESMPHRGRMFARSCGDCKHGAHHSPCQHNYCSCPAEHGEEADKEIAEAFADSQRHAKYESDLAEARSALVEERACTLQHSEDGPRKCPRCEKPAAYGGLTGTGSSTKS